jgi:hypothetical protein
MIRTGTKKITGEKTVPFSLCPPQIPEGLTRESIVWSVAGMIRTGTSKITGEEVVPVSLCPPQIPDGLTRK